MASVVVCKQCSAHQPKKGHLSHMMKIIFCVTVLVLIVGSHAQESWDSQGIKLALRVYDECSNSEGFSPCLKKKALTFLNRLSRMDKLNLVDGVTVVKADDVPAPEVVTDEQLENSLPRAADARDAALDNMLMDKVTSFISSRTVTVTLPKISVQDLGLEEGRGKKMKGMMSGMMMGVAAKMAAMVPMAIAGLFLLAGKALITAKIALLISGIIALKKLLASKGSGGGGGHGGWQSGGGGGGWQSGGGGGWDRRSLSSEAQKLAYKAYAH